MCVLYSKKFGHEKFWRICTQNMSAEKIICLVSIYIVGNQGKTKGWRIKLWRIDRQSPNLPKFISTKVFYHNYGAYICTYMCKYV